MLSILFHLFLTGQTMSRELGRGEKGMEGEKGRVG